MIVPAADSAVVVLPLLFPQKLRNFVDFLLIRADRQKSREWAMLSLVGAMRGMEAEASFYTLEDLKVVFG